MSVIATIGGGIGALAASIELQSTGENTIIIEKGELIGGKMSQLVHEGFTFDLGPTVLTMPFVLCDLFQRSGRSIEDYVELREVDPTCRYHWSDGTIFNAYHRTSSFLEEVSRIFPDDLQAVRMFLSEISILYEATKDIFLFNRFDGFGEFLRKKNLPLLPLLPRLGIATTVDRSLRKRFRSAKLVQFFDRFATYNGSSPYRAPATLNIIPHVELAFGSWYPKGGMYSIAHGLERVAIELGVQLNMNSMVHAVVRKGDRLDGVIVNDHRIPVDGVISNVDALWTYRNLLNPAGIPTPRTIERAERSCSGFLILAAVEGVHPELVHHNIFFSDNYPEEFREIFERKRLPREMTIYVSISSRSDPSLAPEGCENWYVLVNSPSAGLEHDDPEAHDLYVASIWSRLEAFGLRPRVQWQSRLTPVDFETRSNSPGGALYGASSNSAWSAFLRPRNKASVLENLYFAGGSVHPGGGVPLAVLSGVITAGIVRQDLARSPALG